MQWPSALLKAKFQTIFLPQLHLPILQKTAGRSKLGARPPTISGKCALHLPKLAAQKALRGVPRCAPHYPMAVQEQPARPGELQSLEAMKQHSLLDNACWQEVAGSMHVNVPMSQAML